MADDDFYQIIDLGELKKYFSEDSNKSVGIVLFLIGLVVGILIPRFDIDSESVKTGMLGGLIIGFIWVAIRYKQSGEKGLVSTQREVFVVLVYIAYFLLGAIAGNYLVKPILNVVFGFSL